MPSMHLSAIRRWVLQSPPVEWIIHRLRELLIGALKQGPMPQHVAFVMDGNRRYARQQGIETVEGHNQGFEALAKILEVCYKSGVKVVTIYAFSVENFKRSRYEVDALMDMAKVKLAQLAQHEDLMDRYGARIQVLGQRELVKPGVRAAMDQAMQLTAANGDAILNICIPYTSHAEMTHAIRSTVEDYSRPMPTPPRSFTESHIADNIRAKKTSTLITTNMLSRTSPTFDTSTPQALRSRSNSSTHPSHLQYRNPIHCERRSAPHSTPSDPQQSPTYSPSASGSGTPSEAEDSLSSSATTVNPEEPNVLDADATFKDSVKLDVPRTSDGYDENGTNCHSYPDVENITPDTLSKHMYTSGTPPVDLLVRTSGVERLSDFMLWQVHQDTQIFFLKCLWPEFDLWSFLPVLVEWQWKRRRGGSRAELDKAKIA